MEGKQNKHPDLGWGFTGWGFTIMSQQTVDHADLTSIITEPLSKVTTAHLLITASVSWIKGYQNTLQELMLMNSSDVLQLPAC